MLLKHNFLFTKHTYFSTSNVKSFVYILLSKISIIIMHFKLKAYQKNISVSFHRKPILIIQFIRTTMKKHKYIIEYLFYISEYNAFLVNNLVENFCEHKVCTVYCETYMYPTHILDTHNFPLKGPTSITIIVQ